MRGLGEGDIGVRHFDKDIVFPLSALCGLLCVDVHTSV